MSYKGHTPWGSLPDAERAEKQRAHRVRAKLRKLGRPSMVDAAPVIQRVRRLHDECGMSHQAIADACPPNPKTGARMGQSSISDLYRGARGPRKGVPGKPIAKVPRTTADRVFAVPYQAVSASSSAKVPAIGTRRRMQALCAIGYGSKFQADFIDQSPDYQYFWRLLSGRRSDSHSRAKFETVEVATREKIKAMYEKLAFTDPADLGVIKGEITKCRNIGVKRGYAPPSCWDEDTIDDPQAFPEWTGECGTVKGFRIHYREGLLPVCEACTTARTVQRHWPALAALWGIAADPGTPGRAIDPEDYNGIVAALADGALSVHAVAATFGVSSRTVTRIRKELGDAPGADQNE